MSKCNKKVQEWLDKGKSIEAIVVKVIKSATTEEVFEKKIKELGISNDNDVFCTYPIFVVNCNPSIAKKILGLDEVKKIEFTTKRNTCIE